MKKPCTCLEDTRALFATRNTRVIATVSGKIALYVEKIDSHVRGRPTNVVANHCPFCGKKYPVNESHEPKGET